MFKKTIRFLLASAFAIIFALPTTACSKGNSSSHEVWGTFATAKVGQSAAENDNFTKTAAAFDVQMMKNETEGGQIIITAGKDVSSFELIAEDLKTSDGKIFPKENISVYQEKYIKVKQKLDFNGVYAVGEYVPDMLLPMSIAKEYGENSVKKGNNQGVYAEFDSEGVEAGVYSGSFTLETDGEKRSIPVTVEVWDIEYTGRRSFQSCFVLYQSSLLRSEYDDSQEVVDKYVDFFLNYKINSYVHNRKRNNWQKNDGYKLYGEEWLDSVQRNKDNLNYNSVYIPYQFQPGYTAFVGGKPTAAADDCVDYIVNLAKICTPEFNYIEHAYFYPFEIDEADIEASGSRAVNAERLLREGGEVDQTLAYAVEVLRMDVDDSLAAMRSAYGDEFVEGLLDSVLKIPTLFTNVTFKSDWVDDYSAAAFCPYLSLFGSGAASDRYTAAAESSGRGIWAYTCVGPTYPYPTFHLDDYNLGTRISGWMEKKYNINGYLYWSTTEDFYHEEWYKYLNPYEDPTRWKGADGDGYLVYPGKYYGSDTPIPSLRLVAYRDSMDDYDMLCVYEELLEKRYAEYGLGKPDFAAYAEDLYAELFSGTVYDLDDSKLFSVRKELAKRISALQSDAGILTAYEYAGGRREMKIYSRNSSISVNGETLTGKASGENGFAYSVTLTDEAQTINVTAGGVSQEYSVCGVIKAEISDKTVKASEKSEFNIKDGEILANLNSVAFGADTDDFKTINFTPSLTITSGEAKNADSLSFTIENIGGAAEVYVKIISENKNYEIGSMYLLEGETRNVKMRLTNGLKIENGARVVFYVKNVEVEKNEYVLCPDRTLGINDVRFEYAEVK